MELSFPGAKVRGNESSIIQSPAPVMTPSYTVGRSMCKRKTQCAHKHRCRALGNLCSNRSWTISKQYN